jgi:hypothetical protein
MMMLGRLKFEGVGKMDFDENGETDLSFLLKMGTYKLHRRELARPSKFYKSTSMLEEIEHFRASIAM